MNLLSHLLSYFSNWQFILLCLAGSIAGLFIGAIPGLSVSMATALLVSLTYTWKADNALAAVMGVYVVGVFSGAISAILFHIPGAPSSVVTTLDGYPLTQKGQGYAAIQYAAVYSFIGSVFGILALLLLAKPISFIALRFRPMDYFLLSLLGLITVGGVSSQNIRKGLFSGIFGLFFSLVGMDSVMGVPRFSFGIGALKGGIPLIPALIGLFGFAEILTLLTQREEKGNPQKLSREKIPPKKLLAHFFPSLYYATIGTLIGALPGAGGPVAAFFAYNQAKVRTKHPSAPFGQGAIEGIVASETANNACIGGALIPMLTLAVPGDAVTAIILSIFYVHGLRPGPMFLSSDMGMFAAIVAGGLLGSLFLLLIGVFLAPRLASVLSVPKAYLIPVSALFCFLGAFSASGRLFDVYLMLFFGILGFLLRRWGFPLAPLTLGLVLGGGMDANFRRAISLASTANTPLAALFLHPITLVLLGAVLFSLCQTALKREN